MLQGPIGPDYRNPNQEPLVIYPTTTKTAPKAGKSIACKGGWTKARPSGREQEAGTARRAVSVTGKGVGRAVNAVAM